MQIYVVGSLEPPLPKGTPAEQHKQEQEYTQEQEKFTAACRALGYALVRAGHTVRVGLSTWSKLDSGAAVSRYVIEGASQAAQEKRRRVKVIFDVPRNAEGPGPASDELEALENLAKLDPEYHFMRVSPSGISLSQEIEQADAFILVGGGTGTDRIGYAAYQMRKPVVAVTAFGRAAKAIFEDVLYDAYDDELAADIIHLQGDWAAEGAADPEAVTKNRERAGHVVTLAAKVAKNMSARSRQGWAVLGTTIAASCLLLIGWVALYLAADSELLTASIAFFALLFIAAAVGTGLRVLVAYQRDTIARLYWRWLLIEVAVALILAFGLALLYLIGGISFTGNVVALDPASGAGTVFSTVALTMSLLGLAAGFVAPVDRLRKRLEKALEERQEGQPG